MTEPTSYPTLHDALRTLPPATRMQDLYMLFGGGYQTVEQLLRHKNDRNYTIRRNKGGKVSIGPANDHALLMEE